MNGYSVEVKKLSGFVNASFRASGNRVNGRRWVFYSIRDRVIHCIDGETHR